MNNKTSATGTPGHSLLAAASCARARRRSAAAATNDQVVVPQVDRRDIERAEVPVERLRDRRSSPAPTRRRTSAPAGSTALRLGYHITEDFFVEGVYGADQGQRRAVPPDPAGRHLPRARRKSSATTTSRSATTCCPARSSSAASARRPSQFYLIAGVGSTKFDRAAPADLQRRLRLPRLPRRLGRAAARPARPHLLARPARQAPEHAEPRADRRPDASSSDPRRTAAMSTLLPVRRHGRRLARRCAAGAMRRARRGRRHGIAGDRAGDRRARLHAARDERPEPAPEGAARPRRDGQLLGDLVRPVPRRRCRS